MDRDATLVVRLPAAVKEALRLAAEDDARTMSAMAVKYLTASLAADGYLPRGRKPKPRGRT